MSDQPHARSRSALDAWTPFAAARSSSPGSELPLLYCLPPAGSGASMYRPWLPRLAAFCDVTPLQPPGRETRYGEPAAGDMAELVAGVVGAIDAEAPSGYALFGHSLGARVAFETARALRRAGAPLPGLLVVSGSGAPHLPHLGSQGPADAGADARPREPLSDAECIDFLRKASGTPEELLANRELMGLIVPVLRADLGIGAAYAHTEEDPLDVPILALGGRQDAFAPPDDVAAWSVHTSAAFEVEILDGGHMFVSEPSAAVRVLDLLAAAVRRVADAATAAP